MRRTLRILVGSLDIEHPNSQTVGANTIALLQALGKASRKNPVGEDFLSLKIEQLNRSLTSRTHISSLMGRDQQ